MAGPVHPTRPPWWSRVLTYWGFDAVAAERRVQRVGRTRLVAAVAALLVLAGAGVLSLVPRSGDATAGAGDDLLRPAASAAPSTTRPPSPVTTRPPGTSSGTSRASATAGEEESPSAAAPATPTGSAAPGRTSATSPGPATATTASPTTAPSPPATPPGAPTGGSSAPAATVTFAPAPPPVVLEAEAGRLGGGGRVQPASQASGGSVVGNLNDAGAFTEVSYRGATAGSGTIAVRYSNGNGDARSLSLYVNGTRVARLAFAPTGGWDSFAQVEVVAPLQAGTNTLRLARDPDDLAAADVDRLVVSPAG